MNLKVSIIVPNYNHELFLKERLDSIFAQTYKNFEVILLDDASTDNSLEILKRYENKSKVSHVVVNQTNSGSPFVQWKKGIDLAKGDLIWIAESDDYNESKFLETVIKEINEEVGVSYSQSEDVDTSGRVLSRRLNYTSNFTPNIWKKCFTYEGLKYIENYFIEKNVIPNASAVVFKKKLVDNDTFTDLLLNMRMCGDWLFWIKLCEKTNIRFVNNSLNFIRSHSSMSRNHSSKSLKKIRLLEEVSIRNYMFNNFGFKSQERNLILYQTWSNLHRWYAVFTKDFYKIRIDSSSKKDLFTAFITFKIKSYLS